GPITATCSITWRQACFAKCASTPEDASVRQPSTIDCRRAAPAPRRRFPFGRTGARTVSIAAHSAWLAVSWLGLADAQPAATAPDAGLARHGEHAADGGSPASAASITAADRDAAFPDVGDAE